MGCMVNNRLPQQFGFRSGDKGTHTSRTVMFDELSILLDGFAPDIGRSEYLAAIIERNALGKKTMATRILTAQRLSELYILDPTAPLFRVLRRFWQEDAAGRP